MREGNSRKLSKVLPPTSPCYAYVVLHCTGRGRLCPFFQFQEAAFTSLPISHSPSLPPRFVSFPCLSVSLSAHAASFAKARRFSAWISRLNIDRESEGRKEGLREIFPLFLPSAMAPPRRNPMFCICFKRESCPFACIHTTYYIGERERQKEKEGYRCRHHAHSTPLHSLHDCAAKSKVFRDHC